MSDQAEPLYVIGVDVGTGSARAGVFDVRGQMLAAARHDIALYHGTGGIVEQSSDEIWRAVSHSVKEAVTQAGIDIARIGGIGFDATCSLVVLGQGGAPLPVSEPAHPERNIMLWMDHRAVAQSERINETAHPVLKYVGGRISPEMETPKLLWLKENRPDIYASAWQFMDLTDFLTWRASGDLARSICTVTCKWTYLAHERAWDESYFTSIGLGDLTEHNFARIGSVIVNPGAALGRGLTEQAAADLGLAPGIPVAAGLIDAHAGGVGSVGAAGGGGSLRNLAYVFGTSSCTMTSTADPVFVPGVWGPYYSAMVPGLWLNEGGQSAAGAAIDQLLAYHPYAEKARTEAEASGLSLPEWLAARVSERLESGADIAKLAAGIHVVPEFLGNRSPHADPDTRAVIAGIGMERDLDSLMALYVAGLCGIGYGLRQIIAAQTEAGAPVAQIVISGGAGRSDLVRQLLADTTGITVAGSESEEPVLLGSAILAAVAGGTYPDIDTAMSAMSRFADSQQPARASAAVHQRRFEIFEKLQSAAREIAEGESGR